MSYDGWPMERALEESVRMYRSIPSPMSWRLVSEVMRQAIALDHHQHQEPLLSCYHCRRER